MPHFRRTLCQYLAWLIISGAVVWYTASLYKKDETTVADRVGEFTLSKVDRVWFNTAAGFVAQATDGLTVRTLSLIPEGDKGKPVVRQIAEWKRAAESTLAAASPEGRSIVTVTGDQIEVRSPEGKSTAIATLRAAGDPVRIAWSDAGSILVLRPDGTVSFHDPKTLNEIGSVKGTINAADTLVANGPFVAIGNSAAGHLAVFDTRGLPKVQLIETRTVKSPLLALALSPEGRLAVGTQEGPALADKVLQPIGRTQALAFDARGRLIVAGDFEGILLLDRTGETVQLAKMPKGATAIAVSPTHMVYAGGHQHAGILSVHIISAMSTNALWLIKVWIGINLAILVVYLSRTIARLIVSAKSAGGFTSGQGVESLGDLNPPEDLVRALNNHECMVVVGEDPGSRSSLPPWPQFVRRLAEWMVDLNLLPESEAAQVRMLLAASDADGAMAILDEHISQERLRDYARGTYLRAAPLSAIHEKLANVPFSAAMDGCLDELFKGTAGQASVFVPAESEDAHQALASSAPFVMRLRGDWARPETIIVSPQKAAQHNQAQAGYVDFLRSAVASRTVLFVGMSVQDIGTWLEVLKPAKTAAATRKHYALVPQAVAATRAAEAVCRRAGLRMLTYANDEAEQVCTFLDKLLAAYQAELRTIGECQPTPA